MTLRAVGGTVLVVEFLFYLFYRFFLIPRANQRTAPQPYRDYPLGERTRLLRRILARIKATCQVTNRCYRDVVRDFILQWFREIPKYAEAESVENLKQGDPEVKSKAGQNPSSLVVLSVPLLTKATTSSLDSSSMGSNSGSVDDQDSSGTDMNAAEYDSGERLDGTRGWTIPGITRKGTDVFFSWAFFGKELNDLSDEEVIELESFYSVIECECDGLRFTSLENGDEWGSTESMPPVRKHYAPRRLSLEDVNPIHRPLLLYIMIWLIKAVVCHGFLTLLGFRRIQSTSGLVAWYRPSRSLSNTKVANSTETRDFLPLLFFHGIAPAGLAFYVPMVLHLIRDGRAAYLFENAPITYCSAGFGALTEMQTIEGVEEILNRTSNYEGPLALMGHSFGSCQLTWLLESKLQKRIRLLVLLDPVTILLSEPDVMNNFLYSNELSRIRMIAASELFTEHYLRRHFSWYNSELWLDQVPEHTSVLVALSEHDEIINAAKVKRQLDISNQRRVNHSLCLLYWEHVGHAHCVTSHSKWNEIKQRMLRQELALMQCQQW